MTNVLHCTACGQHAEVKCSCKQPYVHMSAVKAAAIGIAAHPNWTSRKIAEAIGCSDKTVTTARESVAEYSATDKPKRVGKDGKKYKVTKPKAKSKAPKPKTPKPDIPPAARDQQFTPQEEWESSLIQLATFILTMDEVWTKRHGDWKQFSMTACTHNLISRAGVAWKGLVDSAGPKLVVNNEKEACNVVSN